MEHRSLARTGVSVSKLCLGAMRRRASRSDEIVPPGTTINHADNGWTARALAPADRRR
jgi:hypothetical protein